MSEDVVNNGRSDLPSVEIATPTSDTLIVEDTSPIEPIEPAPSKAVKIQATVVAKLNLADYQNAVPLIRELRVINETATKYSDLELTLSSDPAVFKPKTWHISELGAKVFRQIPGLDLAVDGGMLAKLTEAEHSTLNFVLTCRADSPEEPRTVIAQTELRLEVLPRNQWGGLAHLPELTAAFVQPNCCARTARTRLLMVIPAAQSMPGKSFPQSGVRWCPWVWTMRCHRPVSRETVRKCGVLAT